MNERMNEIRNMIGSTYYFVGLVILYTTCFCIPPIIAIAPRDIYRSKRIKGSSFDSEIRKNEETNNEMNE